MDELAETMNAQMDAMVATMQMAMAPRYGACVASGDFPMPVLEELYQTLLKKEDLLHETMKLFGYKHRLSKYYHPRDKRRYPDVDIRDWQGPSDLCLPTPVMVVLLFNGIFQARATAQAKAAATKAAKRARGDDVETKESNLHAVKRQREHLQTPPESAPAAPDGDEYEAGGF